MIRSICVVLAFWVVAAQAQECRQSPRMHALDFWIGRWLDYTAEITEARADGSLGYAWGKIRGTSTPLDGSPARSVEDTFLAITRCEADRWLVSHLIWSHAPRQP